MKKRIINKKVVGYIVLVVILLICGIQLYRNRRVHFADEKMRQIICLELGKDKDSKDITYKDLEKIEELKIGPVGEYETIIDVTKFKNLKKLRVNTEVTYRDVYYELFSKNKNGSMYYPPIDKKRVIRIEEELKKIFKKQKKIEIFRFTNVNESCNITDFSFLENATNIEELYICFGNVSDYSFLKKCNKLKSVDLDQCNIETADALLEVKNANRFVLTGTPLAENEKEIKRLQEAFPEAEIIVD